MKKTIILFCIYQIFLLYPVQLINCQLSFNGKIIRLGSNVNSPQDDYAPSISPDGKFLLFVSNKTGSIYLPPKREMPLKFSSERTPSHDIYYAYKPSASDVEFIKVSSIDTIDEKKGINTFLNEGAAAFSSDLKKIYFTSCNRDYGHGDCDLYYADISIEGNNIHIGEIFLFPWGINTNVFDAQPAISYDNNTLYFVSTRSGPNSSGKNKNYDMDIGFCQWDTINNIWRGIKNFYGINTKGMEVSPYLAPDNKTFFFASDKHEPNYGGLDLYYSIKDSTGRWSKPINLGKPINTDEDEQFISIDRTGKYLYFSSRRNDIEGALGGYDIYMMVLEESIFR